jgi:hypothetical protein
LVTASAAGTATHAAVWNSSGGIGDGGAAPLTAAITQTNCLTTACAGGSTYSSSGGTYINSGTVPVLEEITATLAGSSGTGGQYQLNSSIGGATGPGGEVANECGNNPPTSITFMVAVGTSFTVTPSVISTCSPAGTWAITSWLEVTL